MSVQDLTDVPNGAIRMRQLQNRKYCYLREHTAQAALESYLEYLESLSQSIHDTDTVIPASFLVRRERQENGLYVSTSLVEDKTGNLSGRVLHTSLVSFPEHETTSQFLFSKAIQVCHNQQPDLEAVRGLIQSLDCECYEVSVTFDLRDTFNRRSANPIFDVFDISIQIKICSNHLSLWKDFDFAGKELVKHRSSSVFDFNELAQILPDIDRFMMVNEHTCLREPFKFKSDENEQVAYDPLCFETAINHAVGIVDEAAYTVIDSMLAHYTKATHKVPVQSWVIGRVKDYPYLAAMDGVEVVRLSKLENDFSFDIVSLWHELCSKNDKQFKHQSDLLPNLMMAGLDLNEKFLIRCKIPILFKQLLRNEKATTGSLLQACERLNNIRMNKFVEQYRLQQHALDCIQAPNRPLWEIPPKARGVIIDTSELSTIASLQVTVYCLLCAISEPSIHNNSQPKLVSFNASEIDIDQAGDVLEFCLQRLRAYSISSFACYIPDERHQFLMPDWLYGNSLQSFVCQSKTLKSHSEHNWRTGNWLNLETLSNCHQQRQLQISHRI